MTNDLRCSSRLLTAAAAALALSGPSLAAGEAPDGARSNSAFSLQTKCAHPELFLITEPLADMTSILRDKCGEPAHSDKIRRFTNPRCEVKNFLRNAIFAAHGKSFRKAKWRRVFGLAVWYQQRASFRDSQLSSQAWRNVKELRKGCVETKQFRKDKKLLQRWLRALHAQEPRKAGKLMAFPFHARGEIGNQCRTITGVSKKLTDCLTGFREAKELIAGWQTGSSVLYSDKGAYRFGQQELAKTGIDVGKTRVVHLNFVPSDLACEMDVNPEHTASFVEDCGGFGMAVTVLISRRNKIVAAYWDGGSACPYVYVQGPDGLVLQGEILRNVIGSQRYTTQTLPVELPAQPVQPVRAARQTQPVELVVREQKDEVTYADDAELIIDGRSVRPLRCKQAPHPLCARDRRYHILRKGDEIRLHFAVPAELVGKDAELRMSGFYIPVRVGVGQGRD